MEKLEDLLKELLRRADKILREELKKFEIQYESANVKTCPYKSVGVQGDKRTHWYPIEVEIVHDGKFVWDNKEFFRTLSNRITNEVKLYHFGDVVINKVLYSLKTLNC